MQGWEQVIHVVFRHGARGPSRNALKPVESELAASQWEEYELENLTELGSAQAEMLGFVFGEKHKESDGIDLVWHSSKVERVVQSGSAFIRGLFRSGCISKEQEEDLLSSGPSIIDDNDPDFYYRAYMDNSAYKAAANELRCGEIFEEKGKLEREFLKTVRPNISHFTEAEQVNVMTYFEELLECEKFWVKGCRDALSKANADSLSNQIASLARWAWNERFYKLEESARLGEPLWSYIQDSLKGKGVSHLKSLVGVRKCQRKLIVVHSAHDYTIMALHSKHPTSTYPSETMGFCSFVEIGEGSATYNFRPFPGTTLDIDTSSVSVYSLP